MIVPLGVIAVLALGASALLTVAALLSSSWLTMWLASLLSLAFCLLADPAVGPYVFLLTLLQLVGAMGLRWEKGGPALAALLAIGIIIWAVVVPLQLALGIISVPLLVALPSIWVVYTGILLLGRGKTKVVADTRSV